MQTSYAPQATPAFSALFARYMSGQITENAFKKIMRTFDSVGIKRNERIAFARFMNEMIAEGKGKLNVPRPDEAESILTEMRAQKS